MVPEKSKIGDDPMIELGPGCYPSPGRLQSVELALADFTVAEKLTLIERIARSIRVEPVDDAERAERQRLNRERLMASLADLPTVHHDDGLSNRDHDKILYGTPS